MVCYQRNHFRVLTLALGVVLIATALALGVLVRDAGAYPRGDTCYQVIQDLANSGESLTRADYDYYAHTAGCDLDEGGVYVRDTDTQYSGHCIRIAYNEATAFARHKTFTSAALDELALRVLHRARCVHFEDGTFGKRR